ncbi:MAG: SIS domain-containing protein [Acetobacteraceae bacterium]|jgi:glucosamine--fructose-6-phosphate aminotransferase (isomerizing)|nr:SIS domain-containing protein [Acetobacteraceae bacterium]
MTKAAVLARHAARLASLRAEPSTDAADDAARLARVERTRIEMLAQGAAIAATLSAARADIDALAARLAAREIREVAIAGCGDSWFVGLAARAAFATLLGVSAAGAQALEYALQDSIAAGPGTVVFGLSAGGNTPAVMAALAAARARGAFCIGVSNTEGSPVLTEFDAGLIVRATRRGWPTQSSTAAIALLVSAAAAIARARASAPPAVLAALEQALAGLPALVHRVTEEAAAPMAEMAERLSTARTVTFTGSGPGFAAAAIGAAKLRELGPIHAAASPLEEMHHYRAQKEGDPLVLLAVDAAARERALDTALVGAAVGGRTLALLGAEDAEIAALVEKAVVLPPVHPLLAAILFAVPLHLFAHGFAVGRAARGLGYPGAWPGEG